MSCILIRFSTNFDIHPHFRLTVLLTLYCCCLYMRIIIIRIKDNKDSVTVSWGGNNFKIRRTWTFSLKFLDTSKN